MLTKITIRNFKQFDDVAVELGNPVVFIGPNNSGKTTALQALALWDIGVRKWLEKRGKEAPKKRPGVTINRRDLLAVPVPDANLLWRNLRTNNSGRDNGKKWKEDVHIEIAVEGNSGVNTWECGLEFDYANNESFYVRPLLKEDGINRQQIPAPAQGMMVSFLPPMSGLAANETRLDPGAISVRLGEGRSAEVIRNLCWIVYERKDGTWDRLVENIQSSFGCELKPPEYVIERGEITMSYRERSGIELDISSSGRGFQQTLLLLAHMSSNPGAVLLLDEPDAHLEILRQRSLYQTLTDEARETNCQIIAASHSEVILNEAADRDVVVAFVGKRPHRIDDRRTTQVVKSLKEIGFDQYYSAEQKGWVLYLEGATDLAMLKALAAKLNHPVKEDLKEVFVHYVDNQPTRARSHFHALKEAKPDLVGFLLCDRLERPAEPTDDFDHYNWTRREFENYVCQPEVLRAWAAHLGVTHTAGALFETPEKIRFIEAMEQCLQRLVPPVALENVGDEWWKNTKASDEFLDRLFKDFTRNLGLPAGLFRKSDYHQLATFVPESLIDPEVAIVLNRIHAVAGNARPVA